MNRARPAFRRDVTAVLLTLGESTTNRALESIRRQTLQPAETVVVRGVTPFFEALRAGVNRAGTPFVVQVDADMVLDETCVERLREAMRPEVGIVVGQLRDPLMGTISGVKLFRCTCFDTTPVRNSISPDVDFYSEIADHGWLTLHILRYAADRGRTKHTFGDHLPALTPAYTYASYYLLGCRYFNRRDLRGFLWRLRQLRESRHPIASVARFALCAGLFSDESRDVPKSSVALNPQLLECLERHGRASDRRWQQIDPVGTVRHPCERFYALGRSLAARCACAELGAWMDRFGALPDDEAWAAEASLYHGFCSADRPQPQRVVAARLHQLQGDASRPPSRRHSRI